MYTKIPEEEDLQNETSKQFAKAQEDILLEEMHYNKNGELEFGFSGLKAKSFFCALLMAFRSHGAENFLTTTVEYKTIKYEITVRNLRGSDSPAEKIERQTREIKELESKVKDTPDPKSTICIWDYWHLPQQIKDFLEKEQITTDDVDWFAVRPAAYKDHYALWLEMPAFGCYKVEEYPLNKEGDVLVVGWHA